MTRVRHDFMDNKWILFFAVLFLAGIVVTSGCVSQQPTPQTTATPTGTLAQQTGTISVKETTPVIIPPTGVYVKVSYLGGFSGTYGINNVMQNVRNSGVRLYPVDGAGTLTAMFSKEDKSSHELTAEIWKDGKLLTSGANSTAFGTVSISSQV
jgi:flagellar capping protein FliD